MSTDSSRKSLRVGHVGVSRAHLVLSHINFRRSISQIRSKVSTAALKWNSPPRSGNPVIGRQGPQFTCVMGQCDLLVRLELDDFRFISELQRGFIQTNAQSSSWVFSVPYRSPNEHQFAGRGVQYLVYLRVDRSIYAHYGVLAEKEIVDKIHAVLAADNNISGSLHYTLGWPDLVIEGCFNCSIEEFCVFLATIQGLYVRRKAGARSKPFHVFRRALTIVGASWESIDSPQARKQSDEPEAESDDPKVEPVIFVRTFPGRYADATRRLRLLFSKLYLGKSRPETADPEPCAVGHGSPIIAIGLDGNWDMVVLVSPDKKSNRLNHLDWHRALQKDHKAIRDSGIARTESHLLTSDVDSLVNTRWPSKLSLCLTSLEPFKSPPKCRCAKALPNLEDLFKQVAENRCVPNALWTTVYNRYALFHSTLQDDANCCDTRPALEACSKGLERLLSGILTIRERMGFQDGKEADWYRYLDTLWRHLDRWCTVSRRAIIERTAGSFNHMFQPSQSLSAYRGGVQTILFIADNLIKEFYNRIDPALKKFDLPGQPYPTPELAFTTVYEPVGSILSERFTGVIQIPLRYTFAIHMVLPQLWHEVAQGVFQQHYSLPNYAIDQRLRAVKKQLDKAEKKQPGGTQGASSRNFLPLEVKELQQHLSDMYSDLLVLRYGFRHDYTAFVVYLSTLVFEAAKYNNMPYEVRRRKFGYLVLRLYFAFQFGNLIKKSLLPEYQGVEDRAVRKRIEHWSKELALHCHASVESIINDILKPNVLDKLRYAKETWVFPGVIADLSRSIRSTVYTELLYTTMGDLIQTLWKAKASYEILGVGSLVDTSKFEEGLIVDFEGENQISDYYEKLYRTQVDSLLNSDSPIRPQFQFEAALGRSAILHFQRRQGTEGSSDSHRQ